MAVVMDYWNGAAHITILDDAYRDKTEEEIEERKRRFNRAAQIILMVAEKQKRMKEKEQQENMHSKDAEMKEQGEEDE